MSIESEILRIQRNVANAYAAVSEKGGEVPLQPTSANLEAAVRSIQTGVTQEQLDEAMAVKQDKLTGQPGQAVGFGRDGSAVAVPGWSNPNLLDNWYFVDPINQRGKTEYTMRGYTIDRWQLMGTVSKMTLEKDDVKIENTTDEIGWFATREEPIRFGELVGKTVTVSAIYKLEGTKVDFYAGYVSGEKPYVVMRGTVGIPSTVDKWQLAQFTYRVPDIENISYWEPASFKIYGHSTLRIKAVKVELGTVQTIARQDENGNWVLNDPPPNKELELAKCQRHYVNVGKSPLGLIASGLYFPQSNTVAASIPVPVSMRAKPVVTNVKSYGKIYQNGAVVNASKVTIDVQESGSVRVFFPSVSHNQWVAGPVSVDGVCFDLSADL